MKSWEAKAVLERLGSMYERAERGKMRVGEYLGEGSEGRWELEGEFEIVQCMLKDSVRHYGKVYRSERRWEIRNLQLMQNELGKNWNGARR